MKTLSNMKIGEICTVCKIIIEGDIKRRFTDIGLIENTDIECVGASPAGDPKAYLIRGAVIAIRSEDADLVLVR